MNTSDFYYYLPEELIAQEPLYPRDMSKLLVLDRNSGEIKHSIFKNIVEFVKSGDCLVLNNTRVIPARLFGVKKDTKSVIEFLLLNRKNQNTWEVILRPGKKAKIGSKFMFGDNELTAEVIDILDCFNIII